MMEHSAGERRYSRSSEWGEYARKYDKNNDRNHLETKKSQCNYDEIKDRRGHSSRFYSRHQDVEAPICTPIRGGGHRKSREEKHRNGSKFKEDGKFCREERSYSSGSGHGERCKIKNEKDSIMGTRDRSSQRHYKDDRHVSNYHGNDSKYAENFFEEKKFIGENARAESQTDTDSDYELEKRLEAKLLKLEEVKEDEEEMRMRRKREWEKKLEEVSKRQEDSLGHEKKDGYENDDSLEEGELLEFPDAMKDNQCHMPVVGIDLDAVSNSGVVPGANMNILLPFSSSNGTNTIYNQENILITDEGKNDSGGGGLEVECDEEDDMFSESFNYGKRDVEELLDLMNVRNKVVEATDDDEGYYNYSVGEFLHDRYEILGYFGKGVYSNVLKARDLLLYGDRVKKGVDDTRTLSVTEKKDLSIVAIKLLRNNAHMERAGRKEISICRRLNNKDPENKFHCIRLLDSFKDRQHLCLVFESMDLNLRQIIKKFGHNVGLSLPAVRSYAFQLFNALILLKKTNVIHADLKPDNILVSEDKSTVKLGDFGSAFESHEYELTTELVSRYYRAPEIILGYACSFAIDMFSMGCSLYELATGRYLFPSNNDNHHLQLIMEVKGPFHKKMLQNCYPEFVNKHFSPDGHFLLHEVDPINPNKLLLKEIDLPSKPTRNIAQEIESSYGGAIKTLVDKEMVQKLTDLITLCITPDPNKRITPEKALKHPLFSLS